MGFSFHIIPKLFTPSINPGQMIEMGFFISGSSNEEENIVGKLFMNYSLEYLINPDDPGKFTDSMSFEKKKDGKYYANTDPENKKEYDLNSYGSISVELSVFAFMNLEDQKKEGIFVHTYGESVWGLNRPPLECKINTKSDTPSGNYDLDFVLTYSNGSEIKTNSAKLTIHVNSWIEKHSKTLQIVGVIAGVAGIVGTFFV